MGAIGALKNRKHMKAVVDLLKKKFHTEKKNVRGRDGTERKDVEFLVYK